MSKLFFLIFMFLFSLNISHGQGDSVNVGCKVKLNSSVKLFPNFGNDQIMKSYYYILDNPYIYFKKEGTEIKKDTELYELISIPGKSLEAQGNERLMVYDSSVGSSRQIQNTTINSKQFGKVFWISKTELDKKTVGYYVQSRLYYGVLLVPFKYRFHWNSKNNETAFAFEPTYGAAMGITLGKSKFFDNRLQLLFSGGITGFNGNYVTDTAKISQLSKNKNTLIGFTFCTGLVVKINKFQLCALYGYDLTASSSNWPFNKAPWFSLGLGIPLFNSKALASDVQSQ